MKVSNKYDESTLLADRVTYFSDEQENKSTPNQESESVEEKISQIMQKTRNAVADILNSSDFTKFKEMLMKDETQKVDSEIEKSLIGADLDLMVKDYISLRKSRVEGNGKNRQYFKTLGYVLKKVFENKEFQDIRSDYNLIDQLKEI